MWVNETFKAISLPTDTVESCEWKPFLHSYKSFSFKEPYVVLSPRWLFPVSNNLPGQFCLSALLAEHRGTFSLLPHLCWRSDNPETSIPKLHSSPLLVLSEENRVEHSTGISPSWSSSCAGKGGMGQLDQGFIPWSEGHCQKPKEGFTPWHLRNLWWMYIYSCTKSSRAPLLVNEEDWIFLGMTHLAYFSVWWMVLCPLSLKRG